VIVASALRTLHHVDAFVVIFSNACAGVWALGAHFRPSLRSRWLWIFIVACQILIFGQAALGVAIQSAEDLEPPDKHYLYGFSMIVTVAILYGYRQQMEEQRYLLYAGGSLFLMGLAIRAMVLGT
jgi:hypothetical protein